MTNQFREGDEAKNKYLEQALHANDEAASGAKMSDLWSKDSSTYQNPVAEKPKEEKEPLPPKPTVDEEGYPIIGQVRTYREDLADIIKEDKLSLSRIAMMQSNTNANIPKPQTQPKKQSQIFIIVGSILVVLGIVIVLGILTLSSQKKTISNTETETPKEKYLLFAESKQILDVSKITKTELTNTVQTLEKNFREEDSILEIIPSTGTASTNLRVPFQNILEATGARLPGELNRTLADKFFLGFYSKKGRTDPFLLFYTSSYDIAYPALLNWEGFMRDDFNWLFDTNLKVGTTTIPLSWKDRVIVNKNARSFESVDGRTALFYLFIDDHTVLFARTADTVRKVIDRLREAKFQ